MRIVTRLAKTEFRIGAITVEDGELVMVSHPDQQLKVKAYVGPADLRDLLRAAMNREVIEYFVTLSTRGIQRRLHRRQQVPDPPTQPPTSHGAEDEYAH